jgi:hypothetical protein
VDIGGSVKTFIITILTIAVLSGCADWNKDLREEIKKDLASRSEYVRSN